MGNKKIKKGYKKALEILNHAIESKISVSDSSILLSKGKNYFFSAKNILDKDVDVDIDFKNKFNERYDLYKSNHKRASKKDKKEIIDNVVKNIKDNREKVVDSGFSDIAFKSEMTYEEIAEEYDIDLEKYEIKPRKMWGNTDNLLRSFEIVEKNEYKDDEFLNNLYEKLSQHSPIYDKITYRKDENEKLCMVVSIYDLHLGKYAYKEETNDEYNVDIARKRFLSAVQHFIKETQHMHNKLHKILLVIGNDFFNVDNSKNTTYKGTPQDEEKPYWYTSDVAYDMCVEAIDELMTICDVEVKIVAGNHDEERIFSLGQTLKAHYRLCENVNVDNDPPLRKFFRFGNTAICLTHGDKENKKDISELVSNYVYRNLKWKVDYIEIHTGHLHSINVDENFGVIKRRFSSLSGDDRYHANFGYIMNTKGAEALIYDSEKGYKNNIMFRI